MQLYALGRGHLQSILFAVPNGEDRHPAVAAILSGMSLETRHQLPEEDWLMPAGQGLLPGAVDLILLTFPAATTLIELKTEDDPVFGVKGGKQSKQQEVFEAMARRLGHDYRLITNPTAFWDLCAEKGVHLRVQRPYYVPPRPLPGVVGGANAKRRPRRAASAVDPAQPPAEPPGPHRWSLP